LVRKRLRARSQGCDLSSPARSSLFNRLHQLPLPRQLLLIQTNAIIPRANRQHVARETPRAAPRDLGEVEFRALLPLLPARVRGGPDADGFVLRGRRDVGFGEDGWGPGYVADPVCVAGEGGDAGV